MTASRHRPVAGSPTRHSSRTTGERFEMQTTQRFPSAETRANASTFSAEAFGSSQRKPSCVKSSSQSAGSAAYAAFRSRIVACTPA